MDDIASLVHSDVCHHVLFLAEAISEVKKAFPHVYQAVEIVYYSLAVLTGSNISFISCLGQSAKCLGSGRSLSQPHFSHNSGSNVPSSIEMMYLPSTGKNFQPWKLPHVATYKPLAAVCGEMMKSRRPYSRLVYGTGFTRLNNLPADSVLLHGPVCRILSIEDVVGVLDVLLQSVRNVPLSVVALCRRCGYNASRQDFCVVLEDLLAPPLELSIPCWRQTSDERSYYHR
jgi:hypothetical protein